MSPGLALSTTAVGRIAEIEVHPPEDVGNALIGPWSRDVKKDSGCIASANHSTMAFGIELACQGTSRTAAVRQCVPIEDKADQRRLLLHDLESMRTSNCSVVLPSGAIAEGIKPVVAALVELGSQQSHHALGVEVALEL